MKKNNLSFILLLLLVFMASNWFLYKNYNDLINSNYFLGVITLLVGGVAIFLYVKQKIDNKKDFAKIILQEIRRAEEIIASYKEHGHFKFTKRIIATNSWDKNIHYFVDELNPDELDKISNLYSTGEYLDSVIKMISDTKYNKTISDNYLKQAKAQTEVQLNKFVEKIETSQNNISLPGNTQTSDIGQTGVVNMESIPNKIEINVNLKYDSLNTDILFMQIVSSYEPIYNSNICLKLKTIAGIK